MRKSHCSNDRSWSKALTKSGDKFNTAIEHLKETNLAQLAQDYAGLRDRLITFQFYYLEVLQAVSVQSCTAQQQWMNNNEAQGDMMLDCVDTQSVPHPNWKIAEHSFEHMTASTCAPLHVSFACPSLNTGSLGFPNEYAESISNI